MEEAGNYEDLVGHALKVLNASMVLWFETVLPPLLPMGTLMDDWCFSVRHELRNDRFMSQLDTNALLDCFLAAWDTMLAGTVHNKEPRGLAFELKRHRNRWAHESTFSAREAYRALDATGMFLLTLANKCDLAENIHRVSLMLEDVVLDMARAIERKRMMAGVMPRDFDGDVEMQDVGE